MCEQAGEIQELWRKPFKNYVGDLYWRGKKYLMIPEACLFVTEIMFKPENEHIYLPTQEQLLEGIMSSDCYALKIGDTKYCQNENFGIKIFKQFGHYNIVLENSPSEFAYNWITWKEDSLSECLLDVYMFRLYYKYWHNGKWVVGLWNREDRQFNPIKEKWVKAE